MSTLENSENPDEMPQNLSCHHGMIKQSSGIEVKHNLESSTCDPLKCSIDNPNMYVKIHQNTMAIGLKEGTL